VFEALRMRLGDGAFAGAQTAHSVVSSMSAGLPFGKAALIGMAGLAVVGGLWFFAAQNPGGASREATPIVSAAVSSADAIPAAPAAVPANAPIKAEAEPIAEVNNSDSPVGSEEARPATKRRVRDRLAEEVTLLSRAESALHNGKPTVALDALNEHERKFGNGLLAEERIAARVQALCALGRFAEADVQLARLSHDSLHGQPTRQACGPRKHN
jgi:hypothetical protein